MQNSTLPIRSYIVSIFLLKKDNDETKVLLLRRTGSLAGVWCQVAGKIEANELAWQTALRETREETGLDVTELWSADVCEQFYEVGKECITLAPVFVGMVPPNAKVQLNDEHDSFKWVSFESAREMFSFSGQRRVLDAVKDEFVDRIPNPLLQIKID